MKTPTTDERFDDQPFTVLTGNVTVLPDGSGFSTAVIMSKEEAMALPPEKRPICYRVSEPIYMAVWEAVGDASRCWSPTPSKERHSFNSDQATKIVMNLLFKIAEELERKSP